MEHGFWLLTTIPWETCVPRRRNNNQVLLQMGRDNWWTFSIHKDLTLGVKFETMGSISQSLMCFEIMLCLHNLFLDFLLTSTIIFWITSTNIHWTFAKVLWTGDMQMHYTEGVQIIKHEQITQEDITQYNIRQCKNWRARYGRRNCKPGVLWISD